jgi:hypothetical protein
MDWLLGAAWAWGLTGVILGIMIGRWVIPR